MASEGGGHKKGHGRTKRRTSKIGAYYELTYPLRKLLRMHRHGASIAELKQWANEYKTPSGASGAGVLTRLAREHNLHLTN